MDCNVQESALDLSTFRFCLAVSLIALDFFYLVTVSMVVGLICNRTNGCMHYLGLTKVPL